MNHIILWIYSERAQFALQNHTTICKSCSQEHKNKWPQTFRTEPNRTEPGSVFGSVRYNLAVTTVVTKVGKQLFYIFMKLSTLILY